MYLMPGLPEACVQHIGKELHALLFVVRVISHQQHLHISLVANATLPRDWKRETLPTEHVHKATPNSGGS
jgi:hypothetical protein